MILATTKRKQQKNDPTKPMCVCVWCHVHEDKLYMNQQQHFLADAFVIRLDKAHANRPEATIILIVIRQCHHWMN